MLKQERLLASIRLGAACSDQPPTMKEEKIIFPLTVVAEKSSDLSRTRIKIEKNEKGIFANKQEVLQIEFNGLQLRLYIDDKKFYMIFNRDGNPSIVKIHQALTA